MTCPRCSEKLTLEFDRNNECNKCGMTIGMHSYSIKIDKFYVDFIPAKEQTVITWFEDRTREYQPTLLDYVIKHDIDEGLEELEESVLSGKFVIPKDTETFSETKKFLLNRLCWSLSKEDIEKYILLI